jgi:hypothetical protein
MKHLFVAAVALALSVPAFAKGTTHTTKPTAHHTTAKHSVHKTTHHKAAAHKTTAHKRHKTPAA